MFANCNQKHLILRASLVAKFLVYLKNLPVSKQSVMGRGDSELSEKRNGKIKIFGLLVHENPHHILSSKAVEELPSLSFYKHNLG